MTILVLGDANADLSAALVRFPAEGDDSQITALGWGSGGGATNVAAALALLGEQARLLARVGRDPAAEIALRVARAAGADLAAVQIDAALATGLCIFERNYAHRVETAEAKPQPAVDAAATQAAPRLHV